MHRASRKDPHVADRARGFSRYELIKLNLLG
jgi:hypothetical protein